MVTWIQIKRLEAPDASLAYLASTRHKAFGYTCVKTQRGDRTYLGPTYGWGTCENASPVW